jgi:hypothetical protein
MYDACVNDALQRAERAAEMIKKIATKMDDRWKETNKNRSYAQVVGGYAVRVSQATYAEAPSMALIEEKRIIIRLLDTATAETIKEQLKEEIIERIKKGAGATSVNRQVVAVKKLPSEDLAVYVNSPVIKEKIEFIID